MNGRPVAAKDFLGSANAFSTAVREVLEEKLLHQAAGKHISLPQLKLLTLVSQTEPHSVGDVAAFMGVTKAAAGQTVEKLVRLGWLRRTVEKTDRRTALLSLTKSGQQMLERYESARDKRLKKVFRGFADNELRQLANLLDRVSAEIINHTARPEEICLQCGIYFRDRCLLRTLVGRTCYYQRHRDRKEGRNVHPFR